MYTLLLTVFIWRLYAALSCENRSAGISAAESGARQPPFTREALSARFQILRWLFDLSIRRQTFQILFPMRPTDWILRSWLTTGCHSGASPSGGGLCRHGHHFLTHVRGPTQIVTGSDRRIANAAFRPAQQNAMEHIPFSCEQLVRKLLTGATRTQVTESGPAAANMHRPRVRWRVVGRLPDGAGRLNYC